MHEEARTVLKAALPQALQLLLPSLAQTTEPHVRIERHGDGWQSSFIDRPSFLAPQGHLQQVEGRHYPR